LWPSQNGKKKKVKTLNRLIQYIYYLSRSFHLHGVHSPFVFKLQQDIIKGKYAYYCFDDIESIRAKLLLTQKTIAVEDLGAAGKRNKLIEKRISQIAKNSLKSPKEAQLLFRLAYHFKPKTILELGTSLGITTAYLAKSSPEAKVISIEGSATISKIAALNHSKLNIDNIKLIVGDIQAKLEIAIRDLGTLDMVFFDGNHKMKPTLSYFEICLKAAHEDSVFIFDDIYWSKGMHKAWKEIKAHPRVKLSIDLFSMGIVFFKKDQAKEHFTIYH